MGQSTNILTITGSAAGATLKTGATAGINSKGGITITTATVDISVADTSVIQIPDNGGAITLADANSVILLDSASATVKTTGKKITDTTIGANVGIWAASDTVDAKIGKFVGDESTNTIAESGSSPVNIKKGIVTIST